MANQVVRVRRETIVACMTCPLCNKLFRDATTISECLHTFCRKCIYDKISEEELECCPICNTDLGCVPLEKLRPDHSLQDVRAKIFPSKRRKVNAPEVVPSATLPARRKERSLSSLVVNTPRVSTQVTMTGRRSRAVARKAAALQGSRFSIEKLIKKEEDSVRDHPDSSSSPETSNKFPQNTRQGSDAKLEAAQTNTDGQGRKTKSKEMKCRSKVEVEKNITDPVSSELGKPKILRRVRRKRKPGFGESEISPQAVLEAAGAKHERRFGPVWFSLVASEDQEGNAPLPQIPACYLRIKDGNIPVSFIQKYLMRKLNLTSEAEVEIKCMGQPVVPTLQLYNLVDLWLQTASRSERVPASIGSSAKDFVMVLAYARKVPDP
ncbi:E3 ubiquitin protein ligase DRIP2-like isoform X2 [Quercus robur]|uniref:E3 ubiquitin protein ligase DRIP2-like isoform X2 n=1 Tax=Quercus robur TaxID=38942 RepID=UPI002163C6C2|nr:E3 ubiquitin protein ligase DRIP2-like isoform X2 [Quercus robur]